MRGRVKTKKITVLITKAVMMMITGKTPPPAAEKNLDRDCKGEEVSMEEGANNSVPVRCHALYPTFKVDFRYHGPFIA
jgi:hypothetical protein